MQQPYDMHFHPMQMRAAALQLFRKMTSYTEKEQAPGERGRIMGNGRRPSGAEACALYPIITATQPTA